MNLDLARQALASAIAASVDALEESNVAIEDGNAAVINIEAAIANNQAAAIKNQLALEACNAALVALKAGILVKAGESLQAAVNAAQPGDVIELEQGANFPGQLVLPHKTGVVKIVTAGVGPEGRVTEANMPAMASIGSGGAYSAVEGVGAANWVLENVKFTPRADGLGDVVVLFDANNITFNKIALIGGANGQKRGIRGNGTNIAVIDSHIANCWRTGQDSQAFCAWDGAGPYTILNNYVEAGSENIMFGGADSKSPERIPSDILIQGNHFSKRLEWKGVFGKYVVKNLLEFKSAKRVTVRGNLLENNWTDAQNGYAILVKSVNQGGTAPWSVTEDILFEDNVIRNTEGCFNILGVSSDQPGGKTTRVNITRNELQGTGVGFQIGGTAGDVSITQNTIVNGYTLLQLYGTYAMESLVFKNNLSNHNAYGVKGEATGIGTPSLTKFCNVYDWQHNVLLGGAGKGSYPATTYFDLASVPVGVIIGKG